MALSQVHRRSGSSMRRQVVHDFTPRAVDPSSFTSATAGLVGREDSTEVSKPLPTSVKALAGVIVVFGVVILGIAAWRIGKWRRQKMRSTMAASQRMSKYVSEKPVNAIQVNFDTMVEEEKKSFFTLPSLLPRPQPAHSLKNAVKKGTNRFLGGLHTTRGQISSNASRLSTPPPPVPPKTITTYPIPVVTVNRSASTRSNKSGKIDLRVDVNIQTPVAGHALALQMLTANSAKPNGPVPSPRSSSQLDSPLNKTPATSRSKSTKSSNGKRLPRLMVVTCTFIPSLPDELLIKVGETLRLVEEYEDEWCLVQRVGKADSEKGVIPRFCLHERPDVIARPTHKKGMSSVVSTFSPITPATALRT